MECILNQWLGSFHWSGKETQVMARILIIDDEPQIRSMLRLMLERDGYEVVEAPDGIEGIRAYRQKPADLIITDLIMPNKDGIGMIIELQKEFPDVKIIAMSGGGLNKPEGYLKGAKKLGAACTLTKPIDREEMLRAVKNTIKGSSSAIEEPQSEPE
jgi:CheY-like chemotaxis protein